MTEEQRKELERAHDDYMTASMYDSGGDDGNPHREMEHQQAMSARRRFYDLCEKYGVDPDKYGR